MQTRGRTQGRSWPGRPPTFVWRSASAAFNGARMRKTENPLNGRLSMLAMAGTGYGLIGILVIILLVVLIIYFVRRA